MTLENKIKIYNFVLTFLGFIPNEAYIFKLIEILFNGKIYLWIVPLNFPSLLMHFLSPFTERRIFNSRMN